MGLAAVAVEAGGAAAVAADLGVEAFRNFNPSQPHGSIFYQTSNGALDSAQWSPTLQPQTKPRRTANKFGVTFAESPYIPGLTKPNPKQFMFFNLTGQKNLNAFLGGPERVPTTLEREGNFSESTQVVNGVTMPVTIYDPATGQAVAGDNLANAATPISAAGAGAAAVLSGAEYSDQCARVQLRDDFECGQQRGGGEHAVCADAGREARVAVCDVRREDGASNLPASLRQNINIGYNYSHSASDQRNIFLPLGGTSESDGNALSAGYTVSYGRLSNHATVTWNRLNYADAELLYEHGE